MVSKLYLEWKEKAGGHLTGARYLPRVGCGQTGYVSVAKLRPLMCADKFKVVAVSTQLQVEFECARIEAVRLLDEAPPRAAP